MQNKLSKRLLRVALLNLQKKSVSKKAKFQILDLIIPKERKIRSVVGGLETSLGTTLWEPLAKALASKNGFTVKKSNLKSPTNMPSNLNNSLQTIVDDRKNQGGLYDASKSHEEIKRVCQSFIKTPVGSFTVAPRGRGVDIWLVKDGINYFFDTKTVQPNIGTFTSCMEQVLTWYAYYYSQNPTGAAVARIVFPYNPNPGKSFWDGAMGGGKPLEPDNEAWVENQFWDFCSGLEDTYELITSAFTELQKSGALERTLDTIFRNGDV
ncbi:MAG: TdeIII family type II restriction endonuclease [Robiginitomaculum sp.]|nr:TdeIII family type II restriction endonuclease [Robiginitomaculum sp.]